MPAVVLLLAVLGLPLLLAAGVAVPGLRRWCGLLAPAAPLPALAVAVAGAQPVDAEVGFLLTGIRVGLAGEGRAFLLVAALIWGAAALRPAVAGWRGSRFLLAFLLTQAGSLGALVARDPVGYYLFFSVMTVASYGLVTVDESPESRRAGRLYLSLALLGEMAAVAAFMLAAAGVTADAVALLVFFGLGAKLGVLPLHVALPPAYAAAPAAGGAALGGVLTTVAAAGWLRFLPLGAAPADLPALMAAMGFAAAFLGALLGSLQRDPRALLGYSTVSQMGILTVAVAAALASPEPEAASAAAFFVLHHGLMKAALFLALPGRGQGPGAAGLAILAALSLALAGFPLTGGALAKTWLESGAGHLPLAPALLPWTSAATTVLMARFLWLLHRRRAAGARQSWPGRVFATLALAAPWLMILHARPETAAAAVEAGHLAAQTWPVALGLAVFAAGLAASRRLPAPAVPPGDLAAWLQAAWTRTALPAPHPPARPRVRLERIEALADRVEADFRSLAVAGFLFAVAVVAALAISE